MCMVCRFCVFHPLPDTADLVCVFGSFIAGELILVLCCNRDIDIIFNHNSNVHVKILCYNEDATSDDLTLSNGDTRHTLA